MNTGVPGNWKRFYNTLNGAILARLSTALSLHVKALEWRCLNILSENNKWLVVCGNIKLWNQLLAEAAYNVGRVSHYVNKTQLYPKNPLPTPSSATTLYQISNKKENSK